MVGKRITKNDRETFDFGSKFAANLKAGDTLLLYGDLGAGKTTFTQGLASGLGVTERILSPTFVLVRIHKVKLPDIKQLNHVDLYRLEGKHELDSLGLEEIIDEEDSVSVIEWADRLTGLKPKQGYSLKFEYINDSERKIDIRKL